MTRDRYIQIICVGVLVISLTAAGSLLPHLISKSDDHVLRYTNVSVEGAPPFVVLGTAIGAVRGLIVDYLWIKANAMKEKGLFYEAMADADLITKLQPRFASVWAFHGHNMAYNISVATHTQQERWEWVNAGIRLVRNQGLRYNPNDMELHKELAFWFAHKIEGVSDDAHLYYKLAFCNEWHLLLGEPPDDADDRTAWIKEIADAPETIEQAERRTPGVDALNKRFLAIWAKDPARAKTRLDKVCLNNYTLWLAIKQRSEAAKLLGIEEKFRSEHASFALFDEIAGDPAVQDALRTLLAHVRKRVLKDEYNMDPQLMYEYTHELGPIDWRHGQAHALYWARRGSQFGAGRIADDDVFIVLNNDSQQMQAMQDLARSGRISYDPFSTEWPGRFPDPRWIQTIDKMFEVMYVKHVNVRGAGGERFITFLQNFMSSAVCEWYRAGETERAQAILDRLDSLFGSGPTATFEFKKPLDKFVRDQTFDEYQVQPHLAPRDIWGSLRYGFKVGVLSGRPDVLCAAMKFANTVTDWYKNNSWNEYENKWGIGRMKEIIGDLEDSAELAYLQLITDPGVKLRDRIAIWANTDRVESQCTRQPPVFRAMVYDRAMPSLQRQLAASELSKSLSLEQAFPPPPGLDQAREILVKRQQQRLQEKEEARQRDPISRKS
jgi:hypothetical protein